MGGIDFNTSIRRRSKIAKTISDWIKDKHT